MSRVVSPEAERLLDYPMPVLDKGFVTLVDYMGNDARIAQAARVSTGGGSKSPEEDCMLINHLIKNAHTSPFEHVVIEFHCKMPIFVARQWVRHRTARLNEISGRYSVMKDEFYLPPSGQISKQSKSNMQGRANDEVPDELKQKVLDVLKREQGNAYASYSELVNDGIARELARINLPLSLYTEWYWQMDLHNLFHFLELRLDPHAQWEIRQYAGALALIAKAVAPMAYAAFEKHVLCRVGFSADEAKVLFGLIAGEPVFIADANKKSWLARIKTRLSLAIGAAPQCEVHNPEDDVWLEGNIAAPESALPLLLDAGVQDPVYTPAMYAFTHCRISQGRMGSFKNLASKLGWTYELQPIASQIEKKG